MSYSVQTFDCLLPIYQLLDPTIGKCLRSSFEESTWLLKFTWFAIHSDQTPILSSWMQVISQHHYVHIAACSLLPNKLPSSDHDMTHPASFISVAEHETAMVGVGLILDIIWLRTAWQIWPEGHLLGKLERGNWGFWWWSIGLWEEWIRFRLGFRLWTWFKWCLWCKDCVMIFPYFPHFPWYSYFSYSFLTLWLIFFSYYHEHSSFLTL